jgi:hypothetical protein
MLNRDVGFAFKNGHRQTGPVGPFHANNGSRPHSQTVEPGCFWSFGQPGLPQSFLVPGEVFGTPIRAPHVLESGNT